MKKHDKHEVMKFINVTTRKPLHRKRGPKKVQDMKNIQIAYKGSVTYCELQQTASASSKVLNNVHDTL